MARFIFCLWYLFFACVVFPGGRCSFNTDEDFAEFDTTEEDFSDDKPPAIVPLIPQPEEADKLVEETHDTSSPNPKLSIMDLPEDEFELPTPESGSVPVSVEGDKGTPNNKPTDLKITKVPSHLIRSWNNYQMELLVWIGLMVYMMNFLVGKGKNAKLANAWFTSHKELLNGQFCVVGDDGLNQPGSNVLLKEYEHMYSLWCSGRSFVEGMLVEIRLLNRQCLVSTLMQCLKPSYDSVMIKVIMEDAEMDNWVMALGRKRRLAQLTKDHTDLATFITDKRGQTLASLPESFLVLNEITEATSAVLTPQVCKILTDYEEQIDFLFFSDQYSGPKPMNDEASSSKVEPTQKVLIFSFRLGQKGKIEEEDMASMKPLVQFVFYMIDKVTRVKLSKLGKAKSDKARKQAMDIRMKSIHSQRQEAAQTRKDEKRRAAKERIMAEEDPDKARRLEEREQRKDKKRGPRMKMVKVKGM